MISVHRLVEKEDATMWKRIDSSFLSAFVNILVSAEISVGIAVILIFIGQDTVDSIIIALL